MVNKNLKNCLNLFFSLMLVMIMVVPAANAAVVINEIMPNPSAVSDANGEYVELYNSGPGVVDIDGWTITDAGIAN